MLYLVVVFQFFSTMISDHSGVSLRPHTMYILKYIRRPMSAYCHQALLWAFVDLLTPTFIQFDSAGQSVFIIATTPRTWWYTLIPPTACGFNALRTSKPSSFKDSLTPTGGRVVLSTLFHWRRKEEEEEKRALVIQCMEQTTICSIQ